MRYLAITRGTEPMSSPSLGKRFVGWILAKVLPRANPDFDDRYHLVRVWWLEVFEDSGSPNRELGFDEFGAPIVAGPVGANLGFWLDTDMTFDQADGEPLAAAVFEAAWGQFAAQFAKRG